MIEKAFELTTREDIANLVERKVAEGKALEYKSELPGRTDRDCKEFLADVSAFANSAGGDILFGVEEHEGAAADVPGVELDDVDSQIRWMEDVIRSGVEPRIPGVQVKAITGFPKGPVIAIRVPRSWTGPHMISYKAWSRFYIRTSAGKHMMDVDELRSAFLLAGDLPERIKRFRDHRLGLILAGETPAPLARRSSVALHVLPLAAFGQGNQFSPRAISAEQASFAPLLYAGPMRSRFNLDGFLVTDDPWVGSQGPRGYCQVFRTGIVESVDTNLLDFADSGNRYIPSSALEEEVLKALARYSQALDRLGVVRPWLVSLSLIGVRGYALAVGRHRGMLDTPVVDRDLVVLPDVLMEDGEHGLESRLQPVFDALWNAGGYPRCLHYNEQGEWRPHT